MEKINKFRNSILITLAFVAITNILSFTPVQANTIDDIMDIAIDNSMQCKIDDLNIEIKEEALKQANENAAFLGDAFSPQKILNNRITKEVKIFEAEVSVEVAKRTKQDNINSLKTNINKSIQSLLITQIEQVVENKRLDILMEKYGLLKSKLKQGIITENDLIDIEFSIESKRMDIVKVGDKIITIKNDIKKLLNIPLSSDLIKIDKDIEFDILKHIDANKAVINALNKSTSIYKLTEDVKAKQKVLDLTGQYFPTSNSSYINAKYTLEQAKSALEDAKLNIEVNIKNSYANLLNLRDRVYLAEKYLSVVSEKLELAEIKYKNGIIATDTLINAREALINAQYQRYLAIYNYNLSKIDFENKNKIN